MKGWIKSWFASSNSEYAEWYKTYNEQFVGIKHVGPINNQMFIVLDTETTGLDSTKDSILSIGAIKVKNNVLDVSSALSINVLNEQIVTDTKAVGIHGLIKTNQRGISSEEAIKVFFEYIRSHTIVGHHLAFDHLMLEKLSKKHGGGPIINKRIDTSTLAKRLDDPHGQSHLNPNDYTLDQLSNRFNIATKARHTADGDAYITAILFLKLLDRLEKKGIKNIQDLSR